MTLTKLNTCIKLLVLLDVLAVSLVVPLLSSYFRDAQIDSKLYGLISSIYNLSQIVSGFALSILLDYIPKFDLLLLSFVGSGVSYAIVGLSTSHLLLFGSRLVVGLVKQTMTISTSIIRETVESSAERAAEIGRLSALSRAVFVVGPTLGALLYKRNKALPALASSTCFVVNAVILLLLMPRSTVANVGKKRCDVEPSFLQTVQELMRLPNIRYVLLLRICISFVESSMTSRNILNYYESRFGLLTHQLGYLQSGCMALTIAVQSVMISPVMRLYGGGGAAVYRPIALCVLCLICASMIEQFALSFAAYVAAGVVPSVIASTLLGALSTSAFNDSVPAEHIGKGLGVISICSSAIGVVSPLYGSMVFDYFGGAGSKGAVTAAHYAIVLAVVLARDSNSNNDIKKKLI